MIRDFGARAITACRDFVVETRFWDDIRHFLSKVLSVKSSSSNASLTAVSRSWIELLTACVEGKQLVEHHSNFEIAEAVAEAGFYGTTACIWHIPHR